MPDNQGMNPQVLGAGLGIVRDLFGTGMGLLLEGHNDKRQLRQQKKLQELQILGMKDMAAYNYNLQKQLWKDTGYGAQVEQMKEAGLNPALMYKGAGPGGITALSGGTGVSGGSAPAGGMEIMNMMMAKAQMELVRAQTEKTKAEAKNLPKQGANIEASTESLLQGINNAKAQEELTKVQTRIAKSAAWIAELTQDSQAEIIIQQLSRLEAEARSALVQANVDEDTKQQKIDLIGAQLAGEIVRNNLTEQQINLSKEQQQQIVEQVKIAWAQLKNEQDKTAIQNKIAEFETSFGSQVGGIIGNVLNLIPGLKGKKTTINHTGGQTNTTTHRRE